MNIFDKYYKRYDAWYDRNKFVYLSELKAIRKVLPKKGKGLEIGVGTGRFARALGIKYGIDPSKNMIEIARQRGVNVRLAHGELLPYKNKTFDYVAIIITLCFVKDPCKVLKEAKRVLKKDGKIIIGIIDMESALGKSYRHKRSVFYKQARLFNAKEVADLLNEIGFGRKSYYQTLFKSLDKIKAIEKPKTGFGEGGFVVISAKKDGKTKRRKHNEHRDCYFK